MVYPNPTSESFNISKTENNTLDESDTNISTYELFDLNLNMKLQDNFNNFKKVNISQLRQGLYILKITTGKKVEHHRIIIK